VYPEVRAGADAHAIYRRSCEPYIAAGKPTQLTKAEGEVLRDGYFHGLGHGVGLEVHETPTLRPESEDVLEARNVVTVEPGIYVSGTGGVRIEDLVVVRDDGAEALTSFTKELVTVA
jgi:Xaa-Pro aminopeptidase